MRSRVENQRFIVHPILVLLIVLGGAGIFLGGGVAPATAQEYDCASQSDIPETECDALVALYNSTDGDNWIDNTNWLLTGPCSWFGVYCEAGQVTFLDLDNNGLTGNLPAQLSDLTALDAIWFQYNQLNGSIPPALGSLPVLRVLYLDHNQLSGSIPTELGNLSNLQKLRLQYNQLTGSIPSVLGGLSNLRELWLEHNQLSGGIPPELGNLTNLTKFNLRRNQLTGSIPSQLGNLTNVQEFTLAFNYLSGSIPPELGNLANLQKLFLDFNQLGGNIPSQLGNLTNLQRLALHENHLTGSIPTELGSLTNLGWLMLDQNQLTGSIPSQLGSLTNLTRLLLYANALEGEVPLSITNLVNLDPAYTDIGYNKINPTNPSVISFLNTKDPDWAQTQTVRPTNVQATQLSPNSIRLNWTPILYTGDGGYYEISYAATSGGPYTVHGITANKAASEYVVDGLAPGTTYYFVMRTYTPAHEVLWVAHYDLLFDSQTGEYFDPFHGEYYDAQYDGFYDQQNGLWSLYTQEVSTTTGTVPPQVTLIAPTGTITDYTPEYSWNEAATATSYRLYVEGPTGQVLDQWYASSVCTGGVCAVDPGIILNNGAYRWWVRPRNAAGDGPWSAEGNFTVAAPAPGATTLIAPSGDIGENYTPEYSWNEVANATWYELWVSPLGSSTPVVDVWVQGSAACSAGVCRHTPAGALSSGTYTWTVRTWGPGGYGPWSSTLNFSVGPNVPGPTTLIAPSGDIGADNNPEYQWTEVADATQYRLWVAPQGSGTPVIDMWVDGSAVCAAGTCAYTPATTLANGTFTWTVQTSGPGGYGPWSGTLDFTVNVPPPGATTLIAPTGDLGANNTPTYQWTDVQYATWYRLWVAPQGSSIPVVDEWVQDSVVCAGGNCSYTPAGALADGRYTWSVQTWGQGGYGPWSATLNFTVGNQPPPAPTLISPNGTIVDATPTYTWNEVSTATQYWLYVRRNADSAQMVSTVYNALDICDAVTCSVDPGVTLANGGYTWWVLARNAVGDSPWSAPMVFTVSIPAPAAPTLISPSGTITDTTPEYRWNASTYATQYWLYVRQNPSTEVVNMWVDAATYCAGGVCAIDPGIVLNNGSHTWWVLARSQGGDSPWSTGMNFTVQP